MASKKPITAQPTVKAAEARAKVKAALKALKAAEAALKAADAALKPDWGPWPFPSGKRPSGKTASKA